MKLHVHRYNDSPRWAWECWWCQAGDPEPTWRRAMDRAWQHLDRHRQFGFQGGRRVGS